MNTDGKYININIDYNNNTFSITESASKPKNSAVETLSKIAYILENKLVYASPHSEDIYSKYSESELLKILQEKSTNISTGYHTKAAKLNSVARTIFSKENQVLKIYTRIQNCIATPEVFPLPDDMAVHEISKYLDAAALKAFSQVNRQAKALTTAPIVKRAKEFGYEGKDPTEAFKYINELFKEVNQLVDEKIIPEKHLSYNKIPKKYFFSRGEKLDVEKTLKNLQNCSKEELFTILSNQKIYSPSFNNFKKIFNSKNNWKIIGEENPSIKEKGAKALILAAKNGNQDILKFLLQQGADPNTSIQNEIPPLHHAAQRGDADMVALLLKKAKINEKSHGYNTPLVFACGFKAFGDTQSYAPNIKVIKLLLENGADINARDGFGLSPLDHAAKTGQVDMLKLLLEYGADPHSADNNGYVPLHYAAGSNQLDAVKLLLDCDVKVNEKVFGTNTPLVFASGYGQKQDYKPNIKIIELLLQNGANPNIADDTGFFPLHYAAQSGHADIVKLLLDYEAAVDAPTKENRWVQNTTSRSTPLAFACGQTAYLRDKRYNQFNPEVIELLLQRGADARRKNEYGYSPLKQIINFPYFKRKEALDIFSKYNIIWSGSYYDP